MIFVTDLSGLAVTLKYLLEDEDGVVRERSAKVLEIMARKTCMIRFRGRSIMFTPTSYYLSQNIRSEGKLSWI